MPLLLKWIRDGSLCCFTRRRIPLWPTLSLLFPPISCLFFRFISHCHSPLCLPALPPIGCEISSHYTFSIVSYPPHSFWHPRFYSALKRYTWQILSLLPHVCTCTVLRCRMKTDWSLVFVPLPLSPCFSQPQFSTLSWSRAFSLRRSVIIFNVESALGSVPSLLMKLCPGPRIHSDIKKFLVYQLFCDLWVRNNSNRFLLSCIKHLNI